MKDLWSGIAQHPWKTLGYSFVAFSVMWTLTEALNYFVPEIHIKGLILLGAIVLISIGYALKQVWKPSRIEIKVSNSSTTIEVVFGDLFKQDGIRVIPVNEFFDSKLGLPVSDKSLHGIFIKKCFGGHPESFDTEVAEQLKEVESAEREKVEG